MTATPPTASSSVAGLPLEERTRKAQRERLYARSMSLKTYGELAGKAREYVEAGDSVILDATYSREEDRAALAELLDSLDAAYYFVEARASGELIIERLRAQGV